MNNRKAAKKLIKRAKCCPDYYSEAEVKYAKMIKNREKELTKSADQDKIVIVKQKNENLTCFCYRFEFSNTSIS